jgi:SPFH domain / Band 7 family
MMIATTATSSLLHRTLTRSSSSFWQRQYIPTAAAATSNVMMIATTPYNQFAMVAQRSKSSYVFDGVGGGGGEDMWEWPITKVNTIFNIVPQGHKYVVERFGKLSHVRESGWFIAIPLVDRIAYVIDVRERALDIAPQAAITRDNGAFCFCFKWWWWCKMVWKTLLFIFWHLHFSLFLFVVPRIV